MLDIVWIKRYYDTCRWGLLWPPQVLGKDLLEHWRLHGKPCALVDVKVFLGSFIKCRLKTCSGILHAVVLTKVSGMVATLSKYLRIPCWKCETTQMMPWWGSCNDPDDHQWRSFDNSSDNHKMTPNDPKDDWWLCCNDPFNKLVMTLKNWSWHLMTFYVPYWYFSSLKWRVVCLAVSNKI